MIIFLLRSHNPILQVILEPKIFIKFFCPRIGIVRFLDQNKFPPALYRVERKQKKEKKNPNPNNWEKK